jgi:hypothetical protein
VEEKRVAAEIVILVLALSIYCVEGASQELTRHTPHGATRGNAAGPRALVALDPSGRSLANH